MKSAPISAKERIVTIDIIRGFALLGIFLVNMPAFHSPVFLETHPEYTGLDYWLDLFLQLFVQTKFYTMFSFLFGLGFYIFMSRAEQKGLKIRRLFSRRLFFLLLFGGAHLILLWFGDILLTYALTGFLLLLFYKRKTKTILIWALSLLFLFHALVSIQFFLPEDILKEAEAEHKLQSQLAEYVDVYQHAQYTDLVSYRFKEEVIQVLQTQPIAMITVLAMFLFGLYAGKIGIFQPDTTQHSIINRIWRVSLILSIPLVILLALFKLSVIDLGIYKETAVYLFTSLSGLTLCFFYISSLILLLRKKNWQKLLRPIGYTGQMALTNYLSQTFISLFIFLGLNFYGEVSLLTGTFICIIIYLFQVVFSYIWMKNFKFGPFEWLWRSLTYGYFQSMKKEVNHQNNIV
ncbi:DUF418 domain-containing protein [Peribacillus saganii]|uniref:DUF418 domain-containing protein n=1 Tax=Peribacillus saganii TaxID=2303992 RepID=A0A372LL08_9BACI|nr:DUF418 domain-containing protein [Peribacillus saganii]RFU66862.1 DUF418 domain-containing protein [Peribacillus saganii]